MTSTSFYHAFEAAFRGDRAEITERLRVYLPFVEPLLQIDADRRVGDLGCGRGEWLELMQNFGMQAHGVDLDAGMLKDCYDRNLSAEKGDAIEWLKAQSEGSLSVVSGFHIAEHLPFELLQTMIREALRVLRPGGLLILETPNAENISVGTLTFHMDPTHVRPLPPGLLSFLPRFYGFARVKVLRLQESAVLRKAPQIGLMDVFQGASPDYAVIAQKPADPELLARFDRPFTQDYGLTIDTLAQRYDEGLTPKRDFVSLSEHIAQEIPAIKANIDQLQFGTETLWHAVHELQYQVTDYQGRLDAVYASTSWRITAPLRHAVTLVKQPKVALGRAVLRIKIFIANILRCLIRFVLARPRHRSLAMRLLSRFPRLVSWFRRLVLLPPGDGRHGLFDHTIGSDDLSPRGRAVFKKLQDAVKR